VTPIEDDLIHQARALPRSLEPERDLWPEIEARLAVPDARQTTRPIHTPAPEPPRRSGWSPYGMASAIAAGLLLTLVAGIWLGGAMDPQQHTMDVADSAGPEYRTPVPVAANLAVSPDLAKTRQELAESIYQQLAAMPPETRQVVTENLATINQALDEIDQALEFTPDSGLDRRLLMSIYADQLTQMNAMSNLLRHASPTTNKEITL